MKFFFGPPHHHWDSHWDPVSSTPKSVTSAVCCTNAVALLSLEVVRFFETSVISTRHHLPEGGSLHNLRFGNLKPKTSHCFSSNGAGFLLNCCGCFSPQCFYDYLYWVVILSGNNRLPLPVGSPAVIAGPTRSTSDTLGGVADVNWQTVFQTNQPTRCNNFSSLLLHVYVQLNVFRASSRPLSGAQQLQ